jgi:hypothetical protein
VLEVKITLPPSQKVVGPTAIMAGTGNGFTVIIVGTETAL